MSKIKFFYKWNHINGIFQRKRIVFKRLFEIILRKSTFFKRIFFNNLLKMKNLLNYIECPKNSNKGEAFIGKIMHLIFIKRKMQVYDKIRKFTIYKKEKLKYFFKIIRKLILMKKWIKLKKFQSMTIKIRKINSFFNKKSKVIKNNSFLNLKFQKNIQDINIKFFGNILEIFLKNKLKKNKIFFINNLKITKKKTYTKSKIEKFTKITDRILKNFKISKLFFDKIKEINYKDILLKYTLKCLIRVLLNKSRFFKQSFIEKIKKIQNFREEILNKLSIIFLKKKRQLFWNFKKKILENLIFKKKKNFDENNIQKADYFYQTIAKFLKFKKNYYKKYFLYRLKNFMLFKHYNTKLQNIVFISVEKYFRHKKNEWSLIFFKKLKKFYTNHLFDFLSYYLHYLYLAILFFIKFLKSFKIIIFFSIIALIIDNILNF